MSQQLIDPRHERRDLALLGKALRLWKIPAGTFEKLPASIQRVLNRNVRCKTHTVGKDRIALRAAVLLQSFAADNANAAIALHKAGEDKPAGVQVNLHAEFFNALPTPLKADHREFAKLLDPLDDDDDEEDEDGER